MNRPIIVVAGQSREMNDLEFKQYEIDQMARAAEREKEKQIAIEKNLLLVKLGITEDEAKLLLG